MYIIVPFGNVCWVEMLDRLIDTAESRAFEDAPRPQVEQDVDMTIEGFGDDDDVLVFSLEEDKVCASCRQSTGGRSW